LLVALLLALAPAASTGQGSGPYEYFRFGSDTTGSGMGMFQGDGYTATFNQLLGEAGGTIKHDDYGRPGEGIPYRDIYLKLSSCSYKAFTNGAPTVSQQAGQIDCEATVTQVVHPDSQTCVPGVPGFLTVSTGQDYYDPNTHKTVTQRDASLTVQGCHLSEDWADMHAGNAVTDRITATPGSSPRDPWNVAWEFNAHVPPLPGAGNGGHGVVSISYTRPLRVERPSVDRVAQPLLTPQEVNPAKWEVRLATSPCYRGLEHVVWNVEGQAYTTSKCFLYHEFPQQGNYQVSAARVDSQNKVIATATTDVTIKDYLIVGVGDSMSSGEGDPDIAAHRTVPAHWQNRQCHRSAYSWQATVARHFDTGRETSVSFVHVGCSGATIPAGLIGGYRGIEPAPGGALLPPQLNEVRRLTAGRRIDAMLISIGVNDMHFSPLIKFCIATSNCGNRLVRYDPTSDSFVLDENGVPMTTEIQNLVAELKQHFDALAQSLNGLVDPSRVFLIQYPDTTRNADGRTFCNSLAVTIRAPDSQFLSSVFAAGLIAAQEYAVNQYHWNYISGAANGFRKHGYCAGKARWTVTISDSLLDQHDQFGTLHPNYEGHGELAKLAIPLVAARLAQD
jgi:GDSL-like Lipase/Acylhydrolase family